MLDFVSGEMGYASRSLPPIPAHQVTSLASPSTTYTPFYRNDSLTSFTQPHMPFSFRQSSLSLTAVPYYMTRTGFSPPPSLPQVMSHQLHRQSVHRVHPAQRPVKDVPVAATGTRYSPSCSQESIPESQKVKPSLHHLPPIYHGPPGGYPLKKVSGHVSVGAFIMDLFRRDREFVIVGWTHYRKRRQVNHACHCEM